MKNAGVEFEHLVEIMRTLRSPQGCPWDREQTWRSLTHYVLEEAYEVVDAIDRGDVPALEEEIGDHIFEGVFLAQIAAEADQFTVFDSLKRVTTKLVSRHPHVFQEDGTVHNEDSKSRAPSAEAALARWNARKVDERAASGKVTTTLGTVPRSLPSLLRAFTIGHRAAGVGFDWPRADDVIGKIEEEVAELRETVTSEPANAARAEEEMGDLLFAIANLSRKLGVDPEAALRRANDKFVRRFETVEQRLTAKGRALDHSTLAEMESEWQEVKADEHRRPNAETRKDA